MFGLANTHLGMHNTVKNKTPNNQLSPTDKMDWKQETNGLTAVACPYCSNTVAKKWFL